MSELAIGCATIFAVAMLYLLTVTAVSVGRALHRIADALDRAHPEETEEER